MKFIALANDVRKACDSLPLAFKVIESSLFEKKSDDDLKCMWWEAIMVLRGD